MPVPEARVIPVIRELSRVSANIALTAHARQRMEERDVSLTQVLRVLHAGGPTEGPFINMRGDWQVNLTGRDAGTEITVTAILRKTEIVIVRTVM